MRKMKWMKKIVLAALCICLLTPDLAAKADSTVPYDSYNYDYWEDIVFTPAPYIPDGSVSGTTIGVGSLLSPQDLCVSPNGNIYIADTGNNRILEVDSKLSSAIREIDCFTMDGAEQRFNQPNGVCVSQNGQLYIADSENGPRRKCGTGLRSCCRRGKNSCFKILRCRSGNHCSHCKNNFRC